MLALLGPMLVGVIPTQFTDDKTPLAIGAVFGFALATLWMMSRSQSARARMTTAIIVSGLLSVTLLDIVARPLLLKTIEPYLMIDYPPMPLVRRFLPSVRYRGTIYGEFTREAVMRRYREYRDGSFTTDAFGFRNDNVSSVPFDVIVMGDSYTMGYDTAQEKTWSVLLSSAHGLHVYNLGVGANGPWHELADLLIEADRLPVKPRHTVLLWTLFTGNDLADECWPYFDKSQLPWRRGVWGSIMSLRGYQKQSPLRIMWARVMRNFTHRGTSPGLVVKRFLDDTDILFDRDYATQAEASLAAVHYAPHYSCVRQTIIAMKRFADARHLTLAIMMAPPKEEVYSWVLHGGRRWSTPTTPSGFASAVRDIARDEHIPFVDMKPAFVRASERVYGESGALLYWRDDTHWNVEGNKEAATIAYHFYLSITSGAEAGGLSVFPSAARH